MDFSPLPAEGMPQAEIVKEFEKLRAADKDGRSTFGERWVNDRGLLLDDGTLEIAKKAYQVFFTKNNSSSAILPLESELVTWVLSLFHGERGAAGVLEGDSSGEEGQAVPAMVRSPGRPGLSSGKMDGEQRFSKLIQPG
jgi:glutamate/tyrosine decarboxylase-like PLP-dependent enzyme